MNDTSYPIQGKSASDFVDSVEKGDFHIGQIYDDEPAETLICKGCGCDKFMVGTGNYFTAIKCVNCQYEVCIHEG